MKLTVDEARAFVAGQIARIERENVDKELRPWGYKPCPAASEHWERIQQRIALTQYNPQTALCCESLNLALPERTPAQKAAAMANGQRLAEARAA